ncbi:hypothetical protein Bca4012_020648 [Brassica carinata]|uniref:Ubiquitin-like protease family profile domain-containing protein n=1 Tax=Brassica carinata TaxID=52824 RepID=A0A8X7WI75_BRACI|nr:hypothetical protein Bca52824_001002 [Brassica carinata]
MASSSGERKYPRRLYDVGKTPIQGRSMNHSCYLANVQTVLETVGDDVVSDLRDSAIGVIVKLKELGYTWSASCVHHFLANQLAIESSHEMWSLIDYMPLRFSLYEFGEITGLNCDPFDKDEIWDVEHESFWLEMKVPTSEGPTFKELQDIFPICRNWSREKRVMIGFSSLLESIKIVTYGKKSYTLHGCVHALLIWIFEYVPGIGEKFGNQIEGSEVPLLSWLGSRPLSIELDNMIKDILNGQLDEKYWEVVAATNPRKRKIHVDPPVVPDTVDVGPSTKRKKDKEHVDGCHASDTVVAHNIAILGLVESVKNLTAKIDGIDVNVADKVSKKLDATIQAKVDARVALFEEEAMEKIAMLLEDVKNLKEKASVNNPTDLPNSNDHNSIAQEEDGDSSNAMSWMVQKKINSQDGLPIQCDVKKENKENKTMEKEHESITSEDWEHHLQWEKSEKCRQVMKALLSNLEEPRRRRKPQLTKTQVWPYVGNSTVKRIIKGVTPSEVSYDPFAKVESQKLVKVMDFIKQDLDQEESGYENYGWLCDSHIAAAMLMFHRRSRQSTSLYDSPRIAFLDRWFVKSWVNDFKKQDQKNIELSDMYIKAFNGEYPEQFVTGKKWFADVDSLFLCHLINGNHWVALHIDLRNSTIYIYPHQNRNVGQLNISSDMSPMHLSNRNSAPLQI